VRCFHLLELKCFIFAAFKYFKPSALFQSTQSKFCQSILCTLKVLTYAPFLIITHSSQVKTQCSKCQLVHSTGPNSFSAEHKEDEQAGRIIKQVPKYVGPGNLSLFWVRQKKSARRTSSVNYVAQTTRLLLMMGHVTHLCDGSVPKKTVLHLAALRWRQRVGRLLVILPFACSKEDICAVGNETNCGRTFVAAAHKTSRDISGVSLCGRALFNCARSPFSQQQPISRCLLVLCTQLRKCVFAHHCASVE
jgi:hypothetical protein